MKQDGGGVEKGSGPMHAPLEIWMWAGDLPRFCAALRDGVNFFRGVVQHQGGEKGREVKGGRRNATVML